MDYYVLGESPDGIKELSPEKLGLNDEIQSKIVFIELCDESLKTLKNVDSSLHKNTKYIYFNKSSEFEEMPKWQPLFNKFNPFVFLDFKEKNLSSYITLALEEIVKFEQEEELLKLKKESHQKDLQEIEDLDEMQKKLLRSRQRVLQNKKNEQLNLQCIEIIFNSESVASLEEKLSETLNNALNIIWIRILNSSAEILTDLPTIKYQNQFKTLIFDIEIESKIQGKIIFAKKYDKSFKKDETFICQNISDALSLRIKQIVTEQKIKNIRQQWDSTFNAIPFKAALISRDYDVIKIGGQFKKDKPFKNKKCYKYFWGRNEPCSRCRLGDNFLIDHKNESLEVNSKKIFDPTTEESFYLNFYRDFDVSTSKESSKASLSKLEELGLICGSIAHELNNPLGGIKILLDLIKEDPDAESSEDQEDIRILKESTEHCINTVRELLRFTRKQHDDQASNTLIENVNQVEIFTRAFIQSSGFKLVVLESDHFQERIFSKNSTLTIRLLEMVSQYINKLSKVKSQKREVYLYCHIDKGFLNIFISTEKPESTQELRGPLDTPLRLDPTKVELKEGSDAEKADVLTFQISSQ